MTTTLNLFPKFFVSAVFAILVTSMVAVGIGASTGVTRAQADAAALTAQVAGTSQAAA